MVNVLLAMLVAVDAAMFFMLGNRAMYLSQYPAWLFVRLLFTALQAVVQLWYFNRKSYQSAYRTGSFACAAVVSLTFINYATFALGFGASIVLPLYITTLFLNLIFSVTLITSKSGERLWLKAGGWCSVILTSVTLFFVLVITSGKFIGYHSTIEDLQGIVLCASLLPVLTQAMNFRLELNLMNRESTQAPDIFTYGQPIILLIALGFGAYITIAAVGMKKQLPGIDTAFRKVAEPFDARVFVNDNGDSLNYRLLKPLNYDSTKSYPIVVSLHGSSGTGSDNYLQVVASLMPEFLMHEPNREKYPAFIFVPQCPFGTSWGGHPLPSIDDIVFEALASIESEFSIDADRRYVTGISLGGYGVWHFITSRPQVFAAAIPICGSGNPSLAHHIIDIPVWAFHGAHDDRVPVSGSRNMIEAMKSAGGSPRYTEYPDAGHDIGRMVIETPGLLEWMFEQRRGYK